MTVGCMPIHILCVLPAASLAQELSGAERETSFADAGPTSRLLEHLRMQDPASAPHPCLLYTSDAADE